MPPPVADDNGAFGGVSAALPMDSWLAEGFVYADRDGDGIEDQYDTWPDDAPVLTHRSSANSLSISKAWTSIDGHDVRDTAVEGHLLNLEVVGLPDGGGPVWVVFKTTDGLRASRATQIGESILSVEAYPSSLGAHVVAGSARGANAAIHGLRMNQPLLFTDKTPALAGGEVAFAGRNLDRIEHVMLGDRSLPVVSSTSNGIVVRMPDAPSSNRIMALTDVGTSNVAILNLRQEVELRIADNLELAQSEELRFWHAGEEKRLSHAQPIHLELTAYKPLSLSFDIVSGDTVRSRNRLRAVVWPGDTAAEVSAENSLVGRMLRVRHLLPGLKGDNWSDIRDSVERTIPTQAAQTYTAALHEHVAGRAAAPGEELVVEAVSAYKAIAGQAANAGSSKGGPVVMAEPTTPWGGILDHIIGTTMTYLNLDTTKVNDDAPEGGFVFPELTSGSDYAQVIILRHVDDNLFATNFRSFSGCQFSDSENDWAAVRNGSIDEWKKLWRSDLCVQVDGLVFVSAAVVKPGFRNLETVLAEAAQGQNPVELVRRHNVPGTVDDTTQWGPGGYYLRSDDGLSLCHMETCFIELITSGYGLYKNVPLSANQQQIVDVLRVRMWMDAILPWMLELATFGSEDEENLLLNDIDVRGCLQEDLLNRLDFFARLHDLETFVKANQDKTGAELIEAIKQGIDQTIAPWIRNYLQNEIGTKFIECLDPFKSPEEIQAGVIDALLDKPAGLSTFLEIFEFVQNLGSAALTPEKFVFKIQPRVEIKNVSPRVIDLFNDEGSLSIDGDWLIDEDPNAGTPCSGNGWCPSLVVTDALGGSSRRREIQLNESHIGPNPNGCGFACSNLTIPMTDLADLQDLKSGPVNVELAILDSDYTDTVPSEGKGYPESKLRVPVPGNILTLRTKAKLYAIQPPLAKPFETIRVIGDSLSVYGEAAVYELQDDAGTLPNMTMQKAEDSPSPDDEVRLTVPLGTPIGLYRVVVKPGEDATVENLEPLESETKLAVVTSDRQWVVVGDQGVMKDDNIRVEFFDAGDQLVRYLATNRALTFDLPTNELITNVPLNSFTYGLDWDDSDDPNTSSGFAEVSELVHRIRVTCVTPGENGTCTWGIRSLKDRLCRVKNAAKKSALTAKVADNEFHDYFMEPAAGDDETCTFGSDP